MEILKNILIIFVAVEHIGFLILEMFLWTKPIGLKVFDQTEMQAQTSAALASNQGLYNGFLAAGLIWGLLQPVGHFSFQTKLFFLCCVVIAGLFGGYSVNSKILLIQALPAAAALIFLVAT